jgi:hypothetical protein
MSVDDVWREMQDEAKRDRAHLLARHGETTTPALAAQLSEAPRPAKKGARVTTRAPALDPTLRAMLAGARTTDLAAAPAPAPAPAAEPTTDSKGLEAACRYDRNAHDQSPADESTTSPTPRTCWHTSSEM